MIDDQAMAKDSGVDLRVAEVPGGSISVTPGTTGRPLEIRECRGQTLDPSVLRHVGFDHYYSLPHEWISF